MTKQEHIDWLKANKIAIYNEMEVAQNWHHGFTARAKLMELLFMTQLELYRLSQGREDAEPGIEGA